MEKYEALAISVILFAFAADLIAMALGPNLLIPTTLPGALELVAGAALYIITMYLISIGAITAAVSYAAFGTAPAVSGILLVIATDLFNYGATATDPMTKYVAWFIAGVILAATYWLVQQGVITAQRGRKP